MAPVFVSTHLDLLSYMSIDIDLYLRVLAGTYVTRPPFLKIFDGQYGIIITVSHVQIAHKNHVGKKNGFSCVF